jgi:hypothetical protein
VNDNQGPYVTALLCEKILEEKDGIKTAVRVIDRITHVRVGPDAPSTLPPFDYQLTLFLKMTSGSARGLYTILVNLVAPSGDSRELIRRAMNFEGDDDRVGDLVGRMKIRFELAGVYWFEIFLDDRGKQELLTRLPFRVVYLPQVQSGPSTIPGVKLD